MCIKLTYTTVLGISAQRSAVMFKGKQSQVKHSYSAVPLNSDLLEQVALQSTSELLSTVHCHGIVHVIICDVS